MNVVSNTLNTEIRKKIQIQYLLSFPEGYQEEPGRKWGLILFLHGMDMRGENATRLLNYGLLGSESHPLPFLIAVPQCPSESYWNMERDGVMALIDELTAHNRVDSSRIYAIGYSMGGYGVWDLAIHKPSQFAAIVPVSSGGQKSKAAQLKDTPIWAFHGARDEIVPLNQMIDMVQAVQMHHGNVKLTVYPDLGHDIMNQVLNNRELYEWLLSHKRET